MSDSMSKDEFIELPLENVTKISDSIDLIIHTINGLIKDGIKVSEVTTEDSKLLASLSQLVKHMENLHSTKHAFREVEPELWKIYIQATEVILTGVMMLIKLLQSGDNINGSDELVFIVNKLFEGSQIIVSLVDQLV